MRYGQLIDLISWKFKNFKVRYEWSEELGYHQVYVSLPPYKGEMLFDAGNIGLVKLDSEEFNQFMTITIASLKKLSEGNLTNMRVVSDEEE